MKSRIITLGMFILLTVGMLPTPIVTGSAGVNGWSLYQKQELLRLHSTRTKRLILCNHTGCGGNAANGDADGERGVGCAVAIYVGAAQHDDRVGIRAGRVGPRPYALARFD